VCGVNAEPLALHQTKSWRPPQPPKCYELFNGHQNHVNDFAGATQWIPDGGGQRKLATALQDCRGCDLCQYAEQAVAGEGPSRARMMLVGEALPV